MSERLHARISAGAVVPGFVPRLVVALLGTAAAVVLVPAPFGYLPAALAVVGALFPATLGAWGCALVVALAQLARAPDAADWHPYAVLTIVHLLIVFGALSIVVEPGGVMQLRVLARPMVRWLLVQVPAQCVLIVALMLGRDRALLPLPGAFAAAGAVCAVVIVVLVIRRR
jgi:hypothetical protein